MSGIRKRFPNLMLLVGGLVTALFAGEIVLRIVKPDMAKIQHVPDIYACDDLMGYRPLAQSWTQRDFEIFNTVAINSLGFHDVEHVDTNNGLRIVVLGDSFTAALQVPLSQSWTQVFQHRLRQTGFPGAEVFNFGVDNTGTDVHLGLLKRHLDSVRPHVVILAFYENDFYDMRRPRFRREMYGRYLIVYQDDEQRKRIHQYIDSCGPGALSVWVSNHCLLYRSLAFLCGGPRDLRLTNYVLPPHLGERFVRDTNALPPPSADNLIKAFVDLSRQHGYLFIVVPVPPKGDAPGSLKKLRRNVSQPVLAEVNLIDLLPAIDRMLRADGRMHGDMYWRTDGHMCGFGNHVIGLTMADAIGPILSSIKLPESAARGKGDPNAAD